MLLRPKAWNNMNEILIKIFDQGISIFLLSMF